MKKLLVIMLTLLMLCSCAAGTLSEQPGIDIETSAENESPPEVIIEYGDVFLNATKGTYSWQYDNGDGTITAVEADSSRPTEFNNIASFAVGTEKEAKLIFDENMISYELSRWKVGKNYLSAGTGEDSEIGKEEKIESEDGALEIPNDGNIYVYELYVKYKSGNCHYGFRIDAPDDWGVTLSVKNVTPTGATVVFTQSGGNPTGELTTGSYYWIEYEGEERAFVIDGDIAWTAEAYVIPKDGKFEMNVDWEWLYGELEPGVYRIYKGVSDYRGSGDLDDKTYSAEFTVGGKEKYSVSRMKIVDGAEDGNLVLAGKTAGDVITLNANNVEVFLDGEKADASVLMDGMTADIRHDGYILETYPATFSEVYEVHVYSLGTKNEPGGTFFDLSGLYMKVLDDLWEVDIGLNGGAEYVSIDLSEAPGGLTDGEKSAIAWIFENKHDVKALTLTMEELKNEGYLTAAGGSNDLHQWDNGVLFTITDDFGEDQTEFYSLPMIKFNAMKWRSPLGAYMFTGCSVVWPQMGTWEDYNVGAHAIS